MSYNQYLQGRAIQTGCEWRLKIKVTSSALDPFPVTAKFVAQVRDDPDSPVKTTISTDLGTITRVDETTLELHLKGDDTEDWNAGKVVLDVIRTDLAEHVHLGFDLEIPVKRTITRI